MPNCTFHIDPESCYIKACCPLQGIEWNYILFKQQHRSSFHHSRNHHRGYAVQVSQWLQRCLCVRYCYYKELNTLFVCDFMNVCVCLEGLLVPALPERANIQRGYVTPQQVYNLLNAEAGQPALHDPNYILILDCRSAVRYNTNEFTCSCSDTDKSESDTKKKSVIIINKTRQ